MQISRVQYITNYQSGISHLNQIKQVVKGGINWVQYRPKETTDEIILAEGQEIAKFCKQNSVTFIMNDRVDFAIKLKVEGVHLGKNDMSPMEARKLLGPDKIIGGTANTFQDIVDLVEKGVNYIGLGPFRFTQTKKNLSPILGLKGYTNILNLLNKQGISIPVIGIGGIKETDVETLLETGIHGIAVSTLISNSDSISLKTEKLLKRF